MVDFKELPENIQNQINTLSNSFGVRAYDVYCLIVGTINGMESDKVLEHLESQDNQTQLDLVEVYMCDSVKRFSNFVDKYLTCKEVRDGFNAKVLQQITNEVGV